MAALSLVKGEVAVPAGAVVDRAHPHEPSRARFGRRNPFGNDAFVWSEQPIADAPLTLTVTPHVGWLRPPDDTPEPADVVKQISFLAKSDTVGMDEFRASYRHHVEVARRHMHTLWQYVQHDVVSVGGADPTLVDKASEIVAVSVLWFRSTDDFCHRYFASPEDQREFSSQEGFLDLTKAYSFIVSSIPGAPDAWVR